MKNILPKTYRKKIGLTQEQLASELGYESASYIGEVEAGDKAPSFNLAKAYFDHSGGKVNLLSNK